MQFTLTKSTADDTVLAFLFYRFREIFENEMLFADVLCVRHICIEVFCWCMCTLAKETIRLWCMIEVAIYQFPVCMLAL